MHYDGEQKDKIMDRIWKKYSIIQNNDRFRYFSKFRIRKM